MNIYELANELVKALELSLSSDPDMPTYKQDMDYCEETLVQAKMQLGIEGPED